MKELKIRYSTANTYEIYYEGGGEVPAVLSGKYTDHRTAQKAIDLYLQGRPRKTRKVEDNG
jgi:hypothetical protein